MKLRIKGSSLRLRVSQSEMVRLLADGEIVETIRFAPAADARLTYALVVREAEEAIGVSYAEHAVRVVLSATTARSWAAGNEVGIYGSVNSGDGPLALMVEKDFACLDRDDAQDPDAFPNPNAGAVC